jgi:hypothetical protein
VHRLLRALDVGLSNGPSLRAPGPHPVMTTAPLISTHTAHQPGQHMAWSRRSKLAHTTMQLSYVGIMYLMLM